MNPDYFRADWAAEQADITRLYRLLSSFSFFSARSLLALPRSPFSHDIAIFLSSGTFLVQTPVFFKLMMP